MPTSKHWHGRLFTFECLRSIQGKIHKKSGIDFSPPKYKIYFSIYLQHGEKKSNLPVFVYHHYGSYVFGSASRAEYGPDFLIDHDIILVMGNYRIGALGFLSTEDEICPGNFGLKDQVMILKWVNENIKQFGGDPER